MPKSAGDRAVLIYETDDSGFADSVVEALTSAGIDSYRTGRALPGGSSPTVCIYIRDAADSQRANQILLEQGAAVDLPSRFSARVVLTGAIIAGLVVAFVVLGLMK